jgi:hypothetical protein
MITTENQRARSESIRYPFKAFAPPTLISLARSDSIKYTSIFWQDWYGLMQKGKWLPVKQLKIINVLDM